MRTKMLEVFVYVLAYLFKTCVCFFFFEYFSHYVDQVLTCFGKK
jgi:hypothetical protein